MKEEIYSKYSYSMQVLSGLNNIYPVFHFWLSIFTIYIWKLILFIEKKMLQ